MNGEHRVNTYAELSDVQRALVDAARAIPCGGWSGWGDLAEAAGLDYGIPAREAGFELMSVNQALFPSHRIRMADGRYRSPAFLDGEFDWMLAARNALLREEGVPVVDGVADPARRVQAVA